MTLKLRSDLREVLHRAHRRVMKRNLQVAIPVARSLVAHFPAGVLGARHQATVRMEVTDAGKPLNVIDLEQQGVRDEPTDAGHPH
jgi:hypothetical protein